MEIKTSIKGRGQYATKRIEAGEVVCVDEPIQSRPFDSSYRGGLGVPPDVLLEMSGRVPDDAVDQLMSDQRLKQDGETGDSGSDSTARRIGQLMKNTFRATDPDGSTVRLCLYLQVCVFNHSCWPNAFQLKDQQFRAHVVALRPIEVGEEICICYHPSLLLLPQSERQQLIDRMDLDFQCACDRCSGHCGQDQERLLSSFDASYDQALHQSAAQQVMDATDSRQSATALFKFLSLPGVPSTHYQQLEARGALVARLIELGCFDEAFKQTLIQLRAFSQVLPPNAMIKAKLVSTLIETGKRGLNLTAAQCIEKAVEIDPDIALVWKVYNKI